VIWCLVLEQGWDIYGQPMVWIPSHDRWPRHFLTLPAPRHFLTLPSRQHLQTLIYGTDAQNGWGSHRHVGVEECQLLWSPQSKSRSNARILRSRNYVHQIPENAQKCWQTDISTDKKGFRLALACTVIGRHGLTSIIYEWYIDDMNRSWKETQEKKVGDWGEVGGLMGVNNLSRNRHFRKILVQIRICFGHVQMNHLLLILLYIYCLSAGEGNPDASLCWKS